MVPIGSRPNNGTCYSYRSGMQAYTLYLRESPGHPWRAVRRYKVTDVSICQEQDCWFISQNSWGEWLVLNHPGNLFSGDGFVTELELALGACFSRLAHVPEFNLSTLPFVLLLTAVSVPMTT